MPLFVKLANPVWLCAFIVWNAFLYLSSDVPGSQLPAMFPQQDKIAHFLFYFPAGSLWGLWLIRIRLTMAQYWLYGIQCGVLCGLFDEAHQAFVPLRSPDSLDILADLCGFAFGLYLVIRYSRSQRLSSDV